MHLAAFFGAEEGRQREVGGYREEVGGPRAFRAGAVSDDMGDGLGVDPASRAPCWLAGLKAGGVGGR